MAAVAGGDSPRILRVGPQQPITRIETAAREARDGDVVEIEAGDYPEPVASWPQNRLTVRAVGGIARLLATGRSAEDKGIWVIKGDDVLIENFEFSGARVADENGVGIRKEGPGRLVIRNCRFTRNQMGLLASANPSAELVVERSEFDHNAVIDPQLRDSIGHQIYVGRIARFTLRESYVHHGTIGHLVKSRARENHILYNRITDEAGGRASYELEFPDGGLAYVVGNIIQQGAATEHPAIIAFGAERYLWPRNELHLAHNTLVDDLRSGGVYVKARPGSHALTSTNNLLLGNGAKGAALARAGIGDVRARRDEMPLAARHDYRLVASSPLARHIPAPIAMENRLRPVREYVHPRSSRGIAPGEVRVGALHRPL